MKYITALVAVVVMLTSWSAYGEEPGPNYKHLKPMEWIIGEWTRVTPDSCETDMIGPTYEWGLNKNVIRYQFSVCKKGTRSGYTTMGIIGWDPEKERIVSYSFDSLGARGEGIITPTESTIETSGRYISPHGTTAEGGTSSRKRIDENTWVNKVAGQSDWEFKRKKKAHSNAKAEPPQQ